jgi:predicted amidohydrolase
MAALDEAGKISNTSILFNPKGERTATYRKTHLFSLFGEEKHMAAGKTLGLAETPWGLTGLSVCYDIRFPELFRTYALKGVRIVFSPMAFPYPRLEHWKILVRARAIENQMFVVGTNQVGREDCGPDNMLTYCGDSVIIDPWGRTVVEASETDEALLTAAIDLDLVEETRSKMKVLADRRPDLYELG